MVSPSQTAALPQLGWRSAILLALSGALGIIGFGWPFVMAPAASEGTGHHRDAVWLIGLTVVLVLGMMLVALLDDAVDVKAIALLGVLAAVGAALRPLGAGTAGLEPMFVVLILGGRVLGPVLGFALGNIALLASALLTAGVGPWLPFQMMAAGWVALGAGLLPRRRRGRGEIWLLAVYAVLAGLIFGAMMNLWFWPFSSTFSVPPGQASVPISYDPQLSWTENLTRYGRFYLATSLGWDIPRGVLNALLVLLAGPRLLAALRRTVHRAAFGAPVTFAPGSDPITGPTDRSTLEQPAPTAGRSN